MTYAADLHEFRTGARGSIAAGTGESVIDKDVLKPGLHVQGRYKSSAPPEWRENDIGDVTR